MALGRKRISDKQLTQMILLAGAVSFFLGKKALEGAPSPVVKTIATLADDPVLTTLLRVS